MLIHHKQGSKQKTTKSKTKRITSKDHPVETTPMALYNIINNTINLVECIPTEENKNMIKLK